VVLEVRLTGSRNSVEQLLESPRLSGLAVWNRWTSAIRIFLTYEVYNNLLTRQIWLKSVSSDGHFKCWLALASVWKSLSAYSSEECSL
jgi:hypothetical protein